MTTQTSIVSWEDFTRIHNRESQHLKAEFDSVRQSLHSLEELVNDLRTEVKYHPSDTVQSRLDSFEQRVEVSLHRFEQRAIDSEQRRAESLQTMASLRNHTIRIPTLRIHPVVTYNPERGIIEPEPEWFPKNANEFYSLRTPKTARQRRMLDYLMEFYDVPHHIEASDDGSSDLDGQTDVHYGPEVAVTMLEGVLGLNEENFIHFRQHVKESSRRLATLAGKRSKTEEHERRDRPESQQPSVLPVRTQMETRPYNFSIGSHAASPSSKAQSYQSDNARLEWRSRSTPSEQRKTVNGLAAHVRQMEKMAQEQQGSEEDERESDGSESPTAAFTSSERG